MSDRMRTTHPCGAMAGSHELAAWQASVKAAVIQCTWSYMACNSQMEEAIKSSELACNLGCRDVIRLPKQVVTCRTIE
jgi:hypothetical protein